MTRPLQRHAGAVVGIACGLLILGPLVFTRGFLLRYDMVFVPKLPLSATTLGTSGQVPRAVPNDAVVALLDLMLPGDITQKIVLLGAFVAIGMGVDRWRSGVVTRVCAGILLCWNPWMGERLSIGHWGYLWGYAALVWAVIGALECRRAHAVGESSRRGRVTVVVSLVLSAASGSTGAVLVALALVVIGLYPGLGRARVGVVARVAAVWVAVNAAWWLPFLTLADTSAADAHGVTAFAARADGAGSSLLSLLAGGGIWHAPSWFVERASWPVACASAALLVAGVLFLATVRTMRPAVAAAILGLAVAAAGATPGVRDLVTWVVLNVPGGGLLRDGQKFVALWVVPASLGCALAVDAVRHRARGSLLAPVVLAAGVLAPVTLLPGFAWAHGGSWHNVAYPAGWSSAAEAVDARAGTAVVLPWSTYRRYDWNGKVIVLDPWNRVLDGPTLSDDALPLRVGGHDRVIAGESSDGAAVAAAFAAHSASDLRAALTAAHVTTALIQSDQPGADGARDLLTAAGATPLALPASHDGGGGALELFAVPGSGIAQPPPAWRGAGLGLSALTGAGCVVFLVQSLRRSPARE